MIEATRKINLNWQVDTKRLKKIKLHLDDYVDISCMSIESIEKKLTKESFLERAFVTKPIRKEK